MVSQSSAANSVRRHKVVETLNPNPPHFSPSGSKSVIVWRWAQTDVCQRGRQEKSNSDMHENAHTRGHHLERAVPDTHSVSNVMSTLLITPWSSTVWLNVNVSYHRRRWGWMIRTERNKWDLTQLKVGLCRDTGNINRERCVRPVRRCCHSDW